MNKYTAFLTFIIVLFFSAQSQAQQKPLVTEQNKRELQNFSAQYKSVFMAKKQTAITLAKKFNWPLTKKNRNGDIFLLQGVDRLGFPIYLRTYNNTTAAATTQTNTVQPGGSLNLNLSGSSSFLNGKLAIWDGGSVYTAHQEFAGKTITLHDASSAVMDHSTHVAGTLIAKGVYAPAKGMAFGAATLQSYDFDNDVTEMSSAAAGLLLSNHSYGSEAGWNFNDSQNRWEWYGLPGDTVDYKFGFYDDRAQAWDKISYNAPYYLIVEASGNSRNYNGPSVGSDYWGYKSKTDQTIVDKGPRPATISNNSGYDIISTSANAKNILTVGAVNPLPFGPGKSSDISIAGFSSWGPTDDGRIKPDICGMGVNVLSTSSSSPTSYLTLSGTSMATPNVTGSLYLLQEYYAKQNGGSFMRSATLKGLVCTTAFDAGNTGPDYIYGWGLLNMKAAAQAITDNGTKSLIKESTLTQGQTQTFKVVSSGNGPLTAAICWTDPQGSLSADGTINDRTPKLVNDLDIRVSDGTNTYMPWVLNPNTPGLAATTGDNIRDNIEQIYIAGAVPGQTYTITVSHKKTLQSGSQPYALIVTGIGGNGYCTSAPLSNADSRINNVTLANINNTPAAGCTSYSDYTNLTAKLEQGRTYQLSLTLGTCGSNFDKIAKVFIDWNGNGNFDDPNELVATTGVINGTGVYTTNITVPASVVPGNFSLIRVVLSETSDPATIHACGSYAKGETQDYRVQFSTTSTDAGAISVTTATANGACAGTSGITVRLKNFGSAAISNIPVMVTVTAPDNTVTTFNETYTGTLNPLAEDDFTLSGTFNALAGATYSITATTNLPGDIVTSNNQATGKLVTGASPVPTNLSAYYCNDSKQYLLSGNSAGTLLWYKTPTDNNPIAHGQTAYTKQSPDNNTFYAGVNDFNATVGPATKNAFSAGGYNQFTPSVRVRTEIPAIIESARLYIGNSGKITFTVSDNEGLVVSTATITAVATRTNPMPGAQPDDPNDQGHVYNLNLSFPSAGVYTISISYDNTATIYRSNGGVTGYPFTAGNVFSITGNDATSATAPNDTTYYKNFYYYLYNVHVISAGCPSVSRQAVTVSKPVITQNDNVLSSSFPDGNQWYLNGKTIPGAISRTYTTEQSGDYTVGVTLLTGCQTLSDVYHYAQTPLHPDNSDIGLEIYPVPAKDNLNVLFKAKANEDMTLSLINVLGQVVYTGKASIAAGNYSTRLNVSALKPGSYVVKIMLGSKVYVRKVIVVR